MCPKNIAMTNPLSGLHPPCFIMDEVEFERGVYGFRGALERLFERVEIGYSVKTNSLPYALKRAGELGSFAEVVSHDEYQLARACGFEPCRIIYNGPMKSKETFMEAMNGGAVVNLETKRELNWLAELDQNRSYDVGIRLNINISNVSAEDADGDDDNSRFGFSDESGEFAFALEKLRGMQHIHLAGLHIHRTTHSRDPRFYERSVEFAAEVIKRYELALDYLDVGGGYFGIFRNKPTFNDYADAIYSALKKNDLQNLRIIVEPGNALVASCFSFLTEVIDVKRVDDRTRFVTTDGSRNDVDPFFRKSGYLHEIIYKDAGRAVESLQVVSGCTCLEYDRLFTLVDSPCLEVGDRILYNNVGAYTMTLTPQFIRFTPAVYAVNADGECRLVRRGATALDLMNLETT